MLSKKSSQLSLRLSKKKTEESHVANAVTIEKSNRNVYDVQDWDEPAQVPAPKSVSSTQIEQCPVCLSDISHLKRLEEKENHINICLDSSASTSSHNDIVLMAADRGPLVTPSAYNDNETVARKLDRKASDGNPEILSVESENVKSFPQLPAISDVSDFDISELNKLTHCPSCKEQWTFQVRDERTRLSHIQQCVRKNGLDYVEIIAEIRALLKHACLGGTTTKTKSKQAEICIRKTFDGRRTSLAISKAPDVPLLTKAQGVEIQNAKKIELVQCVHAIDEDPDFRSSVSTFRAPLHLIESKSTRMMDKADMQLAKALSISLQEHISGGKDANRKKKLLNEGRTDVMAVEDAQKEALAHIMDLIEDDAPKSRSTSSLENVTQSCKGYYWNLAGKRGTEEHPGEFFSSILKDLKCTMNHYSNVVEESLFQAMKLDSLAEDDCDKIELKAEETLQKFKAAYHEFVNVFENVVSSYQVSRDAPPEPVDVNCEPSQTVLDLISLAGSEDEKQTQLMEEDFDDFDNQVELEMYDGAQLSPSVSPRRQKSTIRQGEQRKLSAQEMKDAVLRFVFEDHDLYNKILRYDPIDLPCLQHRLKDHGIRFSRQLLSMILDEKGIVYVSSAQNNNSTP